MFLGILFVSAVSYPMLRWLYRNEKLSNPDPPDVAEIKREIQIWQRTKASLHAVGGERAWDGIHGALSGTWLVGQRRGGGGDPLA